jgi:glycosyltransferase involved in cell wall biosynthesis
VAALFEHLRAYRVDARVLDVGRGDHAGRGIRPARGALRCAGQLARAAAAGFLFHLHTSGANAKSWALAMAVGRARLPGRRPGILTIHSGLCPSYLAASPWRRRVARIACAGYGRIVAVSPAIAEALRSAGVAGDRLEVLSAFSTTGVRPAPPPRMLLALRHRHRRLVCAAVAPGPTYGIDLLLAAFFRLRAGLPPDEVGLVLFGPGSEALDRMAVPVGVHGLGERPHPEALAWIAGCDLFVRPTRADGDALSVREAVALGRPVVASAVGLRPSGCRLVSPGDPEALAAEMASVLGQPGAVDLPVPDGDPLDRLRAIYEGRA